MNNKICHVCAFASVWIAIGLAGCSGGSGEKRLDLSLQGKSGNLSAAPASATSSSQALQNSAVEYPTQASVTVSGAVISQLNWTVNVADEDVATAAIDPATGTVSLYPKSTGTTQVEVSASDVGGTRGRLAFDFVVNTDYDQRTLSRQSAVAPILEFSQDAGAYSIFFLDVNGSMFQGSRARILEKIRKLPDLVPGEPLPQKIWRTMASHTIRGATLTADSWVHDPALVMNSIGFVYCDDVASAFGHLASQAGLQSRVWTLGGHVVPELQEGGRWHMYDPDEGVFYVDEALNIAGVEELAAEPALITTPIEQHVVERPTATPYSAEVAEIYRTTQDNVVLSQYTKPVASNSSPMFLPPGSRFQLGGHWAPAPKDSSSGTTVPDYANARLIVPAGWIGRVTEPLVLVDVRGEGTIQLESTTYTLGSAELSARLADLSKGPVPVDIKSSQADITLVYLINPLVTRFNDSNLIELEGVNVQGLTARIIDEVP